MANASSKIAPFPSTPGMQMPDAASEDHADIRGLADQLQEAAREARIRQQVAEEERDHLQEKVSQLEDQVTNLRREIGGMAAGGGGVSEKEFKALEKQKGDAIRQRDLSVKVTQDLQQQVKELEQTNHDLDHHLTSIRLARDNAAAQVAELRIRVAELEDEVANIGYDKDVAMMTVEKSTQEIVTLRKQLSEAGGGSAADSKQIDELSREIADLKDANAKLLSEGKKVGDMEVRLQSESKRATAAEEALAAAEDKIIETTAKAEAEARKAAETQTLLEEKLAELDVLSIQLTDQSGGGTPSEEFMKEFEELKEALSSARNDLQSVMLERDTFKAKATEGSMEMDAQVSDYLAEIGTLKREIENNSAKLADYHELKHMSETQRLNVIELGAKLDNSQRELRELSAALAEVRLAAKMAGVSIAGAPPRK
jgi:chromosome segregation ATPase